MTKGKLRISDIFSALYTIFMVPWVFFLIIADIIALMWHAPAGQRFDLWE